MQLARQDDLVQIARFDLRKCLKDRAGIMIRRRRRRQDGRRSLSLRRTGSDKQRGDSNPGPERAQWKEMGGLLSREGDQTGRGRRRRRCIATMAEETAQRFDGGAIMALMGMCRQGLTLAVH